MFLTGTTITQILIAVTVLAAVPGLVALWLFVRGLADRIDELEQLRLMDAAERRQLHQELNELRRGLAVLIAQIKRAGMTPEWSADAVPVATVPERGQRAETDRLVDLWERIAEQFSMDEITDLSFRLGLPESDADTVGARARELVNSAKRRRILTRLIDLCRIERPNGGF